MWQLLLQVRQVSLLEVEFSHELEYFICSSEDCIAAFEGSLAEESLEDSMSLVPPSLPLSIRHRQLVQVSEEWVHKVKLWLVYICSVGTLCLYLRLHFNFFWFK